MVIIIAIIMFIECSLHAGTVLTVLQVLLIARVAGRHYYYFYLTETEAQGDFGGVQSVAQKQRAEI